MSANSNSWRYFGRTCGLLLLAKARGYTFRMTSKRSWGDHRSSPYLAL